MRFGAIFATLTLAISASAASIYPRDTTTNNVGGVAAIAATVGKAVSDINVVQQNNDHSRRQVGGNTVENVVQEATSELSGNPLTSVTSGGSPLGRRGGMGVPDVISGVIVEVKAITVQIDAKITAVVAVKLLTNIKVILFAALDKIVVIVKAGGSDVLLLDGEVVTVVRLGALIAELITLVVGALKLVLGLSVEVTGLVGQIVVALCAIVKVVIAIGVKVAVDITAVLDATIIADLKVQVFAALAGILLIK